LQVNKMHGQTKDAYAELDLLDEELDDDPDQVMEIIDSIIEAWRHDWEQSAEFAELTDEQRESAPFLVDVFAEYMYGYHDQTPRHWTAVEAEKCCVSTLPRHVGSDDDDLFAKIAPVLSSFFRFADRTHRLPGAARLADRLAPLSHRIAAAANDPRNWSLSKTIMMAAHRAGVDIYNAAQLDAFIMRSNEQMAPEYGAMPGFPGTFRRPGPKIGRNDPCPCGSGKKFKKCCDLRH
jgi:hypothetical protein